MAHKSQEKLAAALAQAAAQVTIGGLYRHYKDPAKTYEVIGLAIQECDDAVVVLYRATYGEHIMFTRPLDSWLELVNSSPRFTLV